MGIKSKQTNAERRALAEYLARVGREQRGLSVEEEKNFQDQLLLQNTDDLRRMSLLAQKAKDIPFRNTSIFDMRPPTWLAEEGARGVLKILAN